LSLFRKKKPKIILPQSNPKDLSHVLLDFGNNQKWRLQDACEGTQVFGATGSGKSSGSGQAIAKSFLASGYGGLVMTAKPDETKNWKKYARDTGRESDLIFFGPSHFQRFNFLEYELACAGNKSKSVENLVTLFYSIIETIDGEKNKSQDSFWDRSLKQMIRNCFDLIKASRHPINLKNIKKVIDSAPQTNSDVQNENSGWHEKSYLFQCILDAEKRVQAGEMSKSDQEDFDLTVNYWLNEFPNLASRTRSIVVTSFTSMADSFLRGSLRELFCTKTNFFPELTRKGAIIVLDMNIKEWGDVGRYSQIVFKYIWQKAMERCSELEKQNPVFLWADESQFFASLEDLDFQSTARASRCCTVYLTQNLSTYDSVMGNKDTVRSIIGNLNNKIFHANGEKETNEFASDTIARNWQDRISFNYGENDKDQPNRSHGTSQSFDYSVPPQEFTTLARGGPDNDYVVEGILFVGGKKWEKDKNFIKLKFKQ